jgi:2'-5' RNA ligase
VTHRLFFGAFPPKETLAELEERLDGLCEDRRSFRWTETSQRHVTLFFLGDTPDSRMETLRAVVAPIIQNASSFRVSLGGFGAFPDFRRPKVLFVTAGQSDEGWSRVMDAMRPDLTSLRFRLETKPFLPHLTLARVKEPRDVEAWVEPLHRRLVEWKTLWQVDRIQLVSSHLEPAGARYETLETYHLKKAE